MLTLHIAIALASIVAFSARLFTKHQAIQRLALGSAAATFLSGAALIATNPTTLSHACISGIVYLSTVLALGYAARRQATTTP